VAKAWSSIEKGGEDDGEKPCKRRSILCDTNENRGSHLLPILVNCRFMLVSSRRKYGFLDRETIALPLCDITHVSIETS
jgi:hypothetical protein